MVILGTLEVDGATAFAWGPIQTRRVDHITYQQRTPDGPLWSVDYYGRDGKDWKDVAAPTAEQAIAGAELTSMERLIGVMPNSGWQDWQLMGWTALQVGRAVAWAADLSDPIRQIALKYGAAA